MKTYAYLRGFDFLAKDMINRMRFCQPIVSFKKEEDSNLYIIDSINNWRNSFFPESYASKRYSDFREISHESVSECCTLVDGFSHIKRKRGVLVIGKKFYDAISKLSQKRFRPLDYINPVEITKDSIYISIIKLNDYIRFVNFLVKESTELFDDQFCFGKHLNSDQNEVIREFALYILRGLSLVPADQLLLREITHAKISNSTELLEKLIVRASYESPVINYLFS